MEPEIIVQIQIIECLRPPYPVNKAYQLPSIQCCFIAICVCIKPSQSMVLYQGGPLCQLLQEIGPWVCDGLIQTYIAMKQHCMEGS